jgi:hypothetical protein
MGGSQQKINGLNLGADAYMTKPFQPEELAAQIAALLRQVYRRRSSRKNCFAEGVRQPYIILSDYSGDYPTQVLVVYPAAGGEEVTTAGYAAAKPLPYYVASELDEYPPSTLVVCVRDEEARAAGYDNAISLSTVQHLHMLDTEYAAMLQAEEQNSA